ncbi:hypothetical protein K7432_013213 [Basidiobolus ranarum]|uniref:F-box domain-containing protein n=1 Tax=Basidiobolus ranarum TaxID=34480 RepID=A0ABR2VR44_9FUNG
MTTTGLTHGKLPSSSTFVPMFSEEADDMEVHHPTSFRTSNNPDFTENHTWETNSPHLPIFSGSTGFSNRTAISVTPNPHSENSHTLFEALLDSQLQQQWISLLSVSENSSATEILHSSRFIDNEITQISMEGSERRVHPLVRKDSAFEPDDDVFLSSQSNHIDMYERGNQAFEVLEPIQGASKTLSGIELFLPDELLLNIFEHLLSFQSCLLACTEISRQWNRCVTPFLYHSPTFKSTFHWAMFLQTLLRPKRLHVHESFIRKIDLSPGAALADICVSASSLIQLSKQCPKLQYLSLSGCSIIRDVFYPEINEYQSMMQHTPQPGLTCVPVSAKEAIESLGKWCPQLRYVNLSGCDWVCVDNVLLLVKLCSNLEVLDLRKCLKIHWDTISTIQIVLGTNSTLNILWEAIRIV